MKTPWAAGALLVCAAVATPAVMTSAVAAANNAKAPTSAVPAAPPIAGAAKFVPIFAPLRSARASLSLDGSRVAYTVRRDNKTALLVAPADNPTSPGTPVVIGLDDDATPQEGLREEYPLRVLFLGWVNNDRLVLTTNAFSKGTSRMSGALGGEILGIDADGRNAKTLFTPQDTLTIPDVGLVTSDRGLVKAAEPALRDTAGEGRIVLPTADKSAAEAHVDRERDPDHVLMDPGERTIQALPVLPSESARALGFVEVLDLWPGEREVMLLKAGAGARYATYHVNVRTGKTLREKRYDIDQAYVPLLDQAGLPRVGVPWSERTPYPWVLRYDLSAQGRDATRDLATLLPDSARTHLALTADNFFRERAMVLGFDHDPAVLYYASNVGRDSYAIYSTNLATGQPSALELAVEGVDLAARAAQGFGAAANFVFDRQRRQLAGVRYAGLRASTVWIDPELQDLQQQLEDSFPGQNVEIQEWDQARRRFLLRTSSPTEAGAFHLFDRETRTLREFAWNLPANSSTDSRRHRVFLHRVERPDGTALHGRLTVPRAARVRPLPVLLVCPSDPTESFSTQFDSELVAFAEMGFAVLEVNARGADGFGLRNLRAIEDGYGDAQIGDLLGMLDAVSKRYTIDRSRVAITGRGYGGYLALRALQLHPTRFRAALARDPFVDLRDELTIPAWSQEWQRIDARRRRWMFGPDDHLAKVSLFAITAPLAHPVLITGDGRTSEPKKTTSDRYRAARRFVAREQSAGAPVEWLSLDDEQLAQLPNARARLFARFEEFLNLSLYDYGVKLGTLEEVNDVGAQP